MRNWRKVAGLLVIALLVLTACKGEVAIPRSYNCNVYVEQGCDKMVIASGGELEIQEGATFDLQESPTFTFGADEKLQLDGDTTNQTQTAGTLDIDVGTVTASVSAFDVAITTDDGTVAATDTFAGKITMTQNDADADAKGLTISAAATANAAANSYEYGISYDCAENTAGACPDGILLLSSGANTGMTDAIDASTTNIVNAINIGANLILGGDESVSIGATDDTLIFTSNDGTPVFTGADAAGASDTIYDTTTTGAITIGSADVTNVTVNSDVGLTFANNSDSVNNVTDAAFDFTRNDAGAVSLFCSDDNAVCDMVYDAGGAAGITVGSADVTNITVNSDVGLTFANNSESIYDGTDGAFDFTRNDAGVVTLTASDDDATAALTVDPGGAAWLTLGSSDVTSVTVIADADMQLWNGASGNVDFTFHDYADATDDDMAHVLLRTNCTDASTGAEDCDFTIGVVEAGAGAETRFDINADAGVTIGSANSTQVVLTAGASSLTYDANDLALTAGQSILPTASITNTGTIFAAYRAVAHDSAEGANYSMFVLPANVNIIDFSLTVVTAFDDSGTDTLDCGTTSGDPDEYVDNLDASAAGINRMGDGADMVIGALGDVGASGLEVLCQYNGQNNNSSAGSAVLVITYMVD